MSRLRTTPTHATEGSHPHCARADLIDRLENGSVRLSAGVEYAIERVMTECLGHAWIDALDLANDFTGDHSQAWCRPTADGESFFDLGNGAWNVTVTGPQGRVE